MVTANSALLQHRGDGRRWWFVEYTYNQDCRTTVSVSALNNLERTSAVELPRCPRVESHIIA